MTTDPDLRRKPRREDPGFSIWEEKCLMGDRGFGYVSERRGGGGKAAVQFGSEIFDQARLYKLARSKVF